MTTLREILKKQSDLRDQLTVANAIILYLNKYISTPIAKAEEKLLNDDGSVVAEESIKIFIQTIQDSIVSPKRVELSQLTNMDLVDIVIERIKQNPGILPFEQIKKAAGKQQ